MTPAQQIAILLAVLENLVARGIVNESHGDAYDEAVDAIAIAKRP